jgi:hypothetical protein
MFSYHPRLEAMRSNLLSHRRGFVVNLSGDAATLAECQPTVDNFLQSLVGVKSSSDESENDNNNDNNNKCRLNEWKTELRASLFPSSSSSSSTDGGATATGVTITAKNEGFVVPTQVNYVGKGGRLYQTGEKISGSSAVVSRALRTGALLCQL